MPFYRGPTALTFSGAFIVESGWLFPEKTIRNSCFGTGTDRIYLHPDVTCRIESPETGRGFLIRQQRSSATVIWNPGPMIKAAAMVDMSGEEYREMVCAEAVIACQELVVLRPGERLMCWPQRLSNGLRDNFET